MRNGNGPAVNAGPEFTEPDFVGLEASPRTHGPETRRLDQLVVSPSVPPSTVSSPVVSSPIVSSVVVSSPAVPSSVLVLVPMGLTAEPMAAFSLAVSEAFSALEEA